MNKVDTFSLIDGNFSSEEAKEILISVFTSKIQFHEVKNLCVWERSGKEDETAVKRIPELRQSMEEIRGLIEEAEINNQRLVVTSEIHITRADL